MGEDLGFEETMRIMIDVERDLARRAPTLPEQADILERELRDQNGGNADEVTLAKHCLLSEIWGALNFDRMIEARERFQELFPEHFAHYLENLEAISWQIIWPGCLECANFDGDCSKGMMPLEAPDGRNRYDRHCSLKSPKQGTSA